MNSPLYTVLIVTWNGDGLLEDCLRSIAAATAPTPHCVVVDNAALESTRELCGRFAFATYVRAPENLGFAGGNDLGLPYCTTEYVCLLNNDTIVHEDSFAPLVDFLERHDNIAVAQGTMKLPNCGGTLDDCGTVLKWYGLQRHRYFRAPAPPALAPVAVFAAKGAFMMIRKAVVAETGGTLFHAHFKSYYEETDFCHRVWLAGREVWFVPTPPIDHLLGATSSRFDNAAIWRQYVANIFFSFSANFSLEGKARILVPFCLVYLAFTLLCLAKGRFRLFLAMLQVPLVNFKRRKKLRDAKAAVKLCRKLPDREILRRVMRARD